MLRTAAVSTTTAEPSGSPAPGPRTSRFPAGTPRWARAAHIAGSQARTAPPLTCPATQAAAWSRTAEASATDGPAAEGPATEDRAPADPWAEARCGTARARPASAASASTAPRRRRLGPVRGAGPATRVSSAARRWWYPDSGEGAPRDSQYAAA